MTADTITLTHDELAQIIAKAVVVAINANSGCPEKDKASRSERNRRYYEKRAKGLYPPTSEWQALRDQVFERDGHRCTYCGSDGNGFSLHCDHVLAISQGGTHSLENLTTACQSCNSSKKAEPVENWRAKRGL